MKSLLSNALVLAMVAVSAASAADKTWTGKISDSMCSASHKSMAVHGKTKMSDRDCTLDCVKHGGKYVFVSQGKVYEIPNQGFNDLEKHAGHTVKLSGEMTGNTIAVSKIEMP